MVLFALFGLIGLLNLYFGSQSLWLYKSGIVDTNKRLSLKILNYVIKKESNASIVKKLIFIRYIYIGYLLIFYFSISLAILKIGNFI